MKKFDKNVKVLFNFRKLTFNKFFFGGGNFRKWYPNWNITSELSCSLGTQKTRTLNWKKRQNVKWNFNSNPYQVHLGYFFPRTKIIPLKKVGLPLDPNLLYFHFQTMPEILAPCFLYFHQERLRPQIPCKKIFNDIKRWLWDENSSCFLTC